MKRHLWLAGVTLSIVLVLSADEKCEGLYTLHSRCESVMMDTDTAVKCDKCTEAREARRQKRREKLKALIRQVALLAQNVLIIATQGADPVGGAVVAEQAVQLAANLIGLIDEARKFEPSLFVEFYKSSALSLHEESDVIESCDAENNEDKSSLQLCSPELLALALQAQGVPEALALFIAKQSKSVVRKVAALQ